MKKIFYFIASAIVALGAVACQNDIDETINPESKGVSFYAEVEGLSRITIGEQDENGYPVIWEEGDQLEVNTGEKIYFFEYDGEKFTCYDEGVENIVGKNVVILYTSSIYGLDSTKGKSGLYLSTGKEIAFSPDMTIKLEVVGSFLRFASEHSVTLSMESSEAYENPFIYNGGYHNSITLEAGDDIWVPFYIDTPTPPHCEYTLSASIDGEVIKSTKVELEKGKIYNLGTIEKPAPAPQTYKVYVIAQPKSAQAAWTTVNFYTWEDGTENNTAAWPGNNITSQKETINDYTYNYYEYPATWNGKNIKVIINNGSAQTSDIPVGVLDKNYYVVYNDEGTVYTEAPAAGSIKEVEATLSEWALAGDFNSWGDKVMEVVAGANNLFVAKNVNISAYTEIKVKKVGDWNTSYGGGITYLNANKWMKLYSGGSNIAIVTAGTYDVYFDKANTKLYLMKSGVDYNTAAEQSANGPAPDTSKYTWGVVGNHNGWGNDNVLAWDGTLGLYVAKGVKLNGEFKVRADKVWTTSFGSGGTVTVNNAKATTVYNNGGNCKLSSYSGTYDIYFWYDTTNIKANGKIWVYTAGNAAPTL